MVLAQPDCHRHHSPAANLAVQAAPHASWSVTTCFLPQAPIPRFYGQTHHRCQFQGAASSSVRTPAGMALWGTRPATGQKPRPGYFSPLVPCLSAPPSSLGTLSRILSLECHTPPALLSERQQATGLEPHHLPPLTPARGIFLWMLHWPSPGYTTYKGDSASLLLHTACSPEGLNLWKNPKPEHPTGSFCFKS